MSIAIYPSLLVCDGVDYKDRGRFNKVGSTMENEITLENQGYSFWQEAQENYVGNPQTITNIHVQQAIRKTNGIRQELLSSRYLRCC